MIIEGESFQYIQKYALADYGSLDDIEYESHRIVPRHEYQVLRLQCVQVPSTLIIEYPFPTAEYKYSDLQVRVPVYGPYSNIA